MDKTWEKWIISFIVLNSFVALVLALSGCASVPEVKSRTGSFESEEFGTVTLTLYDTPCSNETVLSAIPAPVQKEFQSAHETWTKPKPGEAAACWSATTAPFPLPPGVIFFISEKDYMGVVSVDIFTQSSVAPPLNGPLPDKHLSI